MSARYFKAFHDNRPVTKQSFSWHLIADKLVARRLARWEDGKLVLGEGVTIEYVDSRGNRLKE